jgi:hypothetical protein
MRLEINAAGRLVATLCDEPYAVLPSPCLDDEVFALTFSRKADRSRVYRVGLTAAGRWFCPCEAFKFSCGPAKRCKHAEAAATLYSLRGFLNAAATSSAVSSRYVLGLIRDNNRMLAEAGK